MIKIQLSYSNGDFADLDAEVTGALRERSLELVTHVAAYNSGVMIAANETCIAHRLRRHVNRDTGEEVRYYVLLTSKRKVFVWANGTVVVMPRGAERDAWWREFPLLPAEQLIADGMGYEKQKEAETSHIEGA